jgi:hypothetical protein
MTSSRVGALLVVGLAAGCGPELPPPVDPGEAGTQLRTVLDAWKAGDAFDSLASRTPPVVFNEPLWRDGAKLVSYEVGEVQLHGRQGTCKVKLTVQDKDGKAVERRIGYLIDTTPAVVITREGLGP